MTGTDDDVIERTRTFSQAVQYFPFPGVKSGWIGMFALHDGEPPGKRNDVLVAELDFQFFAYPFIPAGQTDRDRPSRPQLNAIVAVDIDGDGSLIFAACSNFSNRLLTFIDSRLQRGQAFFNTVIPALYA